ncbi:cell division protein FtsL [Pelagirhabdus alkalitolerans]|uniref:Cell division protein FtsL n=1 Tax=Pelagirhabdus alkalitolerans TaxID=1612202 RepID=A0A1G6GZY4_9BACI|nr:cell division protein FtsL [Pelagirhabdus alkalitolerans]SDB87511.1 cell division protein FtsL [Pelagirhabdus alkalitolerans]
MSVNEARNYQSTAPKRTHRSEPSHQPKKIVKVNSRKITKGEKIIWGFFGVLIAVSLIYIVSFNSNLDAVNRDIQQLENQIEEQQSVNQNLNHQVMEYSNPERILEIAKDNGLTIQNTEVRQATHVSHD